MTNPREKVDHPAHYNTGSIEVIDAIEAWELGFHLGNVVKYIVRSRHKGCELDDLRKARWYLDRAIWIKKGHEAEVKDRVVNRALERPDGAVGE